MMPATQQPGSIFVQIASYRDPQLIPTIEDALQKAAHPERLRFGICLQDRPDCETYQQLQQMGQCRVTLVAPEDTKGPCFARALTQQLYQGEDYTLQLDSHMRFAPDWDLQLIEMLHSCGEKAILTAYCPGWDPGQQKDPDKAHRLCADTLTRYGVLLLWVVPDPPDRPTAPMLSAFWSGHFAFSRASVIADVPYDPSLFFHGEEISYAVRAWTHGYNLFCPHRSVVFHRYGREGRATVWAEQPKWSVLDACSQLRVRKLLGMDDLAGEVFGPYGLGSARTLEQYQRFAGVNFATRAISDMAYAGEVAPMPLPTDGATASSGA